MLAAALKAEADAYVDALVDQVDEDGPRLVVRNGHHEPRSVVTAAGAVEALAAVKTFTELFGAKFPNAVAKIVDDLDDLLAFYDYPAEHWVHLRPTNPIESTFATVRPRTKITRGPGSRAAGLAMANKLITAAQDRWRADDAPHLVALVRAGATFLNGKLLERSDDHHAATPATAA
jgi:hypothetical protein